MDTSSYGAAAAGGTLDYPNFVYQDTPQPVGAVPLKAYGTPPATGQLTATAGPDFQVVGTSYWDPNLQSPGYFN